MITNGYRAGEGSPACQKGTHMAIEFLEKEDRPFAFDKDSWELFRMDGVSRDTWFLVEDPDSCVRIRSQASVISEREAKSLAAEWAEEG